jgi:hypothetical protein
MTGPASLKPCSRCPWRTENQGKRHPGGWYTAKNLRRLWGGLRRGEGMTCHPTDPNNPVEPEWEAKGVKPAPENARTTECAGAIVLQQRELMRFQKIVAEGGTLADYRRRFPLGLTKEGMARLVSRHLFGGTPLGGPAWSRPNLNQEGIGAPFIPDWNPEEVR